MIKLKNLYTKEIVYFRFFDSEHKDCFWHTPTIEAEGFDFGEIRNYEPIGTTWQELRKNEADK